MLFTLNLVGQSVIMILITTVVQYSRGQLKSVFVVSAKSETILVYFHLNQNITET